MTTKTGLFGGNTGEKRTGKLVEVDDIHLSFGGVKAVRGVSFDVNEGAVGQTIDVLVDGVDNAGTGIARHCGQAPEIDSVCLLGAPAPVGEIVPVEIIGWQDYDLIAQPLSS